jgi:hypothetical protein
VEITDTSARVGHPTKKDYKKHPEKYAATVIAIYGLLSGNIKSAKDAIQIIVGAALNLSDSVRNYRDDQ